MPASITLTVAHLPTSTSFFLTCLQPIGYVYRGRVENSIGFGLPKEVPDFWITQSIPGVAPGPAHVAFPASSREDVQKFFIAAIKAGARCQGEPALRDIHSGYYSAAVIDFDNNSIEAVYRADMSRSRRGTAADARSTVTTTQRSMAKSKAQPAVSTASKAPTSRQPESMQIASLAQDPSVRTVMSRTASQHSVPASTARDRSNGGIGGLLEEAKGTINVAKELMSSMSGRKTASDPSTPSSHQPSDAIVGTLLGVAAGAALHYALSNRTKAESDEDRIPVPMPQPVLARSETAPSYTQQRYNYYYNHEDVQPQRRLDDARSGYSAVSGPRLIGMIDNEAAYSEYTSSATRPRRRSSISGSVPSRISDTHTTATAMRIRKYLEAPPTSYRTPTAMTTRSDSRSQLSQTTVKPRARAMSLSRDQTRSSHGSSRQDEGYASASESRSRTSRRSSVSARSRSSLKDSRLLLLDTNDYRRTNETGSRTGTVVTAIRNRIEPSIMRPSVISNSSKNKNFINDRDDEDTAESFHSSRTRNSTRSSTSTIKPSSTKTSGTKSHHTNTNSSSSDTRSDTKSRSSHHRHHRPETRDETNSNVTITSLTRKQLAKLEEAGRPRSDITQSVIGKVVDVDKLHVSKREIAPEDSVSQVG